MLTRNLYVVVSHRFSNLHNVGNGDNAKCDAFLSEGVNYLCKALVGLLKSGARAYVFSPNVTSLFLVDDFSLQNKIFSKYCLLETQFSVPESEQRTSKNLLPVFDIKTLVLHYTSVFGIDQLTAVTKCSLHSRAVDWVKKFLWVKGTWVKLICHVSDIHDNKNAKTLLVL